MRQITRNTQNGRNIVTIEKSDKEETIIVKSFINVRISKVESIL